jgi:hypothetical protein
MAKNRYPYAPPKMQNLFLINAQTKHIYGFIATGDGL